MKFTAVQSINKRYWIALAAAIFAVAVLASSESFRLAAFSSLAKDRSLHIANTLSHSEIEAGNSVTFTVLLSSNARMPKNVLLDIEIFDSGNRRVAQHYWDNVRLTKGKQVSYELTSPHDLAPGRYKLWVGVFKSNWGSLLDSKEAGSFTISFNEGSAYSQLKR